MLSIVCQTTEDSVSLECAILDEHLPCLYHPGTIGKQAKRGILSPTLLLYSKRQLSSYNTRGDRVWWTFLLGAFLDLLIVEGCHLGSCLELGIDVPAVGPVEVEVVVLEAESSRIQESS